MLQLYVRRFPFPVPGGVIQQGGLQSPLLVAVGRGFSGGGGIETPLPLSGLLVTFAPLQKSRTAGRR